MFLGPETVLDQARWIGPVTIYFWDGRALEVDVGHSLWRVCNLCEKGDLADLTSS